MACHSGLNLMLKSDRCSLSAWAAASNGGLDQADLFGLQCGVAGFAAVAAVRDHGFQGRCALSGWAGLLPIVGCHRHCWGDLHFGDELQFVCRVAGFGQVGDVAFVVGVAFRAVGGFQIIHRLQAAGSDLAVLFRMRLFSTRVKFSANSRSKTW
jgi:hypothetical protein